MKFEISKNSKNPNATPYEHKDPRKYWCFTINNWTDTDRAGVMSLADVSNFGYLVFGEEVGASGTPHLQGYCEFPKGGQRLTALRDKCPRAHWSVRYKASTGIACRKYCIKDATNVVEIGVMKVPAQGSRTDLESIRKAIVMGKTNFEIANSGHFGSFLKYNRGFRLYRSMCTQPRHFKTNVIVRWGDPGCGKTRYFWENYPNARTMSNVNSFWSDYNGEETVLWDDFSPSWMKRNEFLRLTDRYPCEIRQFGCFVNWAPKNILITSNTAPETWYENCPGMSREAVMRRITDSTHCTS